MLFSPWIGGCYEDCYERSFLCLIQFNKPLVKQDHYPGKILLDYTGNFDSILSLLNRFS